MSDLLFGWVLGLFNVIVPYLLFKILKLQQQVKFLANPNREAGKSIDKKKEWWRIW